jgi:glycosyltransferase involved in cell wall biosynthesis
VRVALYLYRFGIANPTGVQRYAQEMARALPAAAPTGQPVEVWAGRDAHASRPVDVDVHHPPVPRRLLHLSWAAVRAPRLDRFTGPVALVHSLSPVTPVPTRAPLVVTIHDLLPLHRPDWYARGPRWSNIRAFRHAADNAAAIITPSRAVADDVAARLGVEPDRLTVVPEGVDPAFAVSDPATVTAVCARHGLTPGRFILAVGEIGPRKNLAVLVQAVARLAPDQRPTLVLVGGDGQDAAAVHALPAQLGVAECVRATGRVDDETLVALLHGARALVHPALYEGFGLTPLEAMSAGTAVIASDAGSLPEVVGDAGLLVGPRDVDGWADAIARVVTDDDVTDRMVAAGRQRAAAFTWAAAARATWQVYDRVGAW